MRYLTLASGMDAGVVVMGFGGDVGKAASFVLVIIELQGASTPSSRFMTSHKRGSARFQIASVTPSLGQAAAIIVLLRSLTLSFPMSLLKSSLSDESPKRYAANPATLAAAVGRK